jgi:hypothetical protein
LIVKSPRRDPSAHTSCGRAWCENGFTSGSGRYLDLEVSGRYLDLEVSDRYLDLEVSDRCPRVLVDVGLGRSEEGLATVEKLAIDGGARNVEEFRYLRLGGQIVGKRPRDARSTPNEKGRDPRNSAALGPSSVTTAVEMGGIEPPSIAE